MAVSNLQKEHEQEEFEVTLTAGSNPISIIEIILNQQSTNETNITDFECHDQIAQLIKLEEMEKVIQR